MDEPPTIGAWLHDDDFGWKARLGAIIPSAGVTFDHEWARMLPKGVSFHVTRLLLETGTPEALDSMAGKAPEAAGLLKTSRVDAICYGCTIGSVYRGRAGEIELSDRLAEAAGAPAIMMANSAVEALRSFGARRIAMANPYTEATNAFLRQYLEECGFELAAIEASSIADSWSITRIPRQDVFALAERALRKAGKVDALFLSCGNMRTIDAIEDIEAKFGVPTISSNQAMLWKALKVLKVDDPVRKYGSLLNAAR